MQFGALMGAYRPGRTVDGVSGANRMNKRIDPPVVCTQISSPSGT